MTRRAFCIVAAFVLAPSVTALAFLEKGTSGCSLAREHSHKPLAEIDAPGAFKSLTFESASSSGVGVYSAEFGRGHVELDLTSFDRDGKAQFHSFHMRY